MLVNSAGESVKLDAWSGISAFGGMVPLTTCRWHSRLAPPMTSGDFGQPCHNGGSVGLETEDWKCLLIHTPVNRPTKAVPERMNLLDSAVSMCHRHHFKTAGTYQPRMQVDLTLIAACIYQAYPGQYIPRLPQRPLRLRGIAIFPVYNTQGSLAERLSTYRIASPLGMLVALHRLASLQAGLSNGQIGHNEEQAVAISYVACFAGS